MARDFDKLVQELGRVSQQIRQSAEDKAHSFKTPLAAIRSALEPVRRAVPDDDRRARRALEIVDSSLSRLLDLVIAAQHHDISTAELIEAPRVPTDFTQLVDEAALHFREILASKDIRLVRRLDERAMVRAGQGMLEAVCRTCWRMPSASRRAAARSSLRSRPTARRSSCRSTTKVPASIPARIADMFERYFSSRPRDAAHADARPSAHAGLGLWIVRRNVEALGGRVSAANRAGGGLSVTVTLPS